MTGKELMIALVGAGLVGGAAGAAASFVAAPKEQPTAQQPSPELLQRLQSAEDELAKTKTALETSRKSVDDLRERVTAAEMIAAKQSAVPVASMSVKPGMHVRRRGAAGGEAVDMKDIAEEVKNGLADVDFAGAMGGDVGVRLGSAIDSLGGDSPMAAQLGSLKAGLDLRKLPEDQRWQKAKDDLGLTWNQVEDLKKAVADRDAAMKDATTTEKKTGANGGLITIQRPDAGKTAHAEADYHDRLGKTLSDDQKKRWQSKGYDHAFGSGPFGMGGGAMMMTIDVATDKQGDVPKEATK